MKNDKYILNSILNLNSRNVLKNTLYHFLGCSDDIKSSLRKKTELISTCSSSSIINTCQINRQSYLRWCMWDREI